MTSTRRELLAALSGAWVMASLGAMPVVAWFNNYNAPLPALAIPPCDDVAGHLLSRCGYGVRPGERDMFTTVTDWLDAQTNPTNLADQACEKRLRRLDTLHIPVGECYEFHDHVVRHELQASIVLRAVYSTRQLQESITEFWRDHFSLSLAKGECAWLATSFEQEALRPHALGQFRDLLRAVLLHPAMLWYLDGRLNRTDDGKPNENYARELMELHTLGLDGGYTQHDVQEAARALSGWTSRGLGQSRKGSVAFDQTRHDTQAKWLLGQPLPDGLGEEEVERVIAVVSAHPATAHFIARKLCVRYLADQPPADVVDAVAATFTATAGDLRATLRSLVTHQAFADSRGGKLKRPLHLVASALRASDADTNADPALLAYLERLGHAPFLWPTPDGYPATADHWRGGLLWRWRFADDLARNAIRGTKIDTAALLQRASGRDRLAAHCLGRHPTPAEQLVFAAGDDAEALSAMLACPGFQRC